MSDEQRPKFGNRQLTDEKNVYEHNAWDDYSWNDEMQEAAKIKLRQNSETIIPLAEQEKYEINADKYWNEFYKTHQTNFFKDRHWLFTEFPDLCSSNNHHEFEVNQTHHSAENVINSDILSKRKVIFEVGCGAGNSVFPILEASQNSNLFIYCCDFSEIAISLVKAHPDFDSNRCHPFVLDLISETWNTPFSEESLDYIMLVFVLSALNPSKMQYVINKLVKYLKPGGRIFFRDYGQYDMVELRFKSGHCLSDHYYVRGDGTKVYFFSEDEVHTLFTEAGLNKIENKIDRRLQVNRGKQLTMYRVWIQANYEKPKSSDLFKM